MEEVVNELSMLKENTITITKRLDGIEGAIHQRFAYLEATITNYQSIVHYLIQPNPKANKVIYRKIKSYMRHQKQAAEIKQFSIKFYFE